MRAQRSMPTHTPAPHAPPHCKPGVTVWELGAVLRGAWAQRYWSSPACLYHHAYPVGYRATKVGGAGQGVQTDGRLLHR